MLFGQLNADIFTIFSGSNRAIYEIVVDRIYSSFFRSDLNFPTQSDVLALIYEQLSLNVALWRDDEEPVVLDQVVGRQGRRLRRRGLDAAHTEATNDAMGRARHIYHRLIATGWLEETRYGLKVTLDMPAAAMRLAEFLCALREGVSEQLGGLVVQVKNGLDALQANARENALGLHKAARDSASFGRYLRSVLSALRDIDKQILSSDSVGQRLRFYFEDFVERILLQDYTSINTTAHPYRYRHRIFSRLDAIEESVADIGVLAQAYLDAHLAADTAQARDMVFDDLATIRRVFERIEDVFERIQQHRGRLETRLRNTVRYAGRRTGGFLNRSEPLLLRLDKLRAQEPEAVTVPGPLEPISKPLSPFLLARPRLSRPPIVGGVIVLPPPDPLRELRKSLEREYLERLTVLPEQVSRFLERRVPPFGEAQADGFPIDTVDDFLAFEALRLLVLAKEDMTQTRLGAHLARSFGFKISEGGRVDNKWLACSGFLAVRTDVNVTLEMARAR
ncbi:Wadjet anti-phage system protein JetA family protein [Xanthobacter aminoxidans]|uniref:Wadjet anti-phage system protein JetA family protein n=1 Tax=Xanthobacter aminoxidans TaxID=186280 RepID=UPI003729C391